MTNQTTQNTSVETTSLFRAAALDYAAMGFKVFPAYEVVRNAKTKAWECACQGRKRKQAAMYGEEAEPCGNPGKHSRGIDSWKTHATADPIIIKQWAKEYPNANIGIVTGKESGLWVLDVDGELGEFLLDEMQAGNNELPWTPTVRTGSGGLHYWFRYPDGLDLSVFAIAIAQNIEMRGEGGYIVAPPSKHRSGNNYEFLAERRPDETSLADAPKWLLKLASRKDKAKHETKD